MRLPIVCCLLAACSGTPSDCRLTADCTQGLNCAGPNDGPVCGIGPREGCVDDSACIGSRCNAMLDSCSRDFVGADCGPACTTDMQCGDGFHCQTGACVAQLCTEGYTCPDYQVCEPGRITAVTPMYDRNHGCFDVACTTDVQCSGHYCVNGICQEGLGSCETPMIVARLR